MLLQMNDKNNLLREIKTRARQTKTTTKLTESN